MTETEKIVAEVMDGIGTSLEKIEQIESSTLQLENSRNRIVQAVGGLSEIAEQDYILTPGRYVGIEDVEDDGEPFDEKMKRLTSELSRMFKKSHELEEEIKKNLKAIGYEL